MSQILRQVQLQYFSNATEILSKSEKGKPLREGCQAYGPSVTLQEIEEKYLHCTVKQLKIPRRIQVSEHILMSQ